MKKIIKPLIIWVVLSIALVSCWQETKLATKDKELTAPRFWSDNYRKFGSWRLMWNWNFMRTWSGQRGPGQWRWMRFWSWSNILKPEDQKIFEEMRQARQANDLAKVESLRIQLEKKYPELFKNRPKNPNNNNWSQSGSTN